MKKIFLILSFLLFAQNSVFAQSKKPFSQLEFDKRPVSVNKEEKLKAILGEETELEKQGENSSEKKVDSEISKALAKFSSQKYELEGPAAFLTPRIKGPLVDASSQVHITSSQGWPFRKSAFCKIPLKAENLCKKTKSLKEVINRFTGNDDFYEISCMDHPCPADRQAYLTELDIPTTNKASFDISIVGSECRYYLQKGAIKDWVLLKAKAATCSCLPVDCEKQEKELLDGDE